MTAAGRIGLVCAVLAALVLSPAASRGAPVAVDPVPPETVIVTGQRPPAATRDEIVRSFVRAHGRYTRIGQISRWLTPVCPEVRNLPKGYQDFIVARITAIAKSVGAKLADSCKPNIEIIFSTVPQAIMDHVAEHDPILLGYHFVNQTQQLSRITRPIQAWYVTATGNALELGVDDPYLMTVSGGAGSRLSHGLRSQFLHILVVVDTTRIGDRPVGPVADYLAMLVLAQAREPDNCADLSSILDMFSAVCPEDQKPATLTIADKAFLEGLYRMNPSDIGPLERNTIAEHMLQTFSAP